MHASDTAFVQCLAQGLGAQVVETHISWVLLGDGVAYKLKKPVRLPFLDYSTPGRRLHFCEEEVRLNQRLAPTLYLGVSRVTGSRDAPVMDGSGPTLDYAVRMRRFPAGALFSEQVAAGTLAADTVDRLVELVAGFHAAAPQAKPGPVRDAHLHQRQILDALEGARPLFVPAEWTGLHAWITGQCHALESLWAQRRSLGRVRECHGDLHLDNLVSLGAEVAAFDCIEFDPALRWIDILDEAAFTLMDFTVRGRADLGWRFFNGWLDRTGDHEGLPALRLALVYRALVRAQVEHLRAPGGQLAHRYARAALNWSRGGQPRLIITHGLPGSGKTFVSQRLLEQLGAIRLRSDVERKRLFGLAPLENSRERGLDLYTPEAGQETYARLYSLARTVLQEGFPVVLDAAFLRREEREQARSLARKLGVPFGIVACKAPLPVLRQRLHARQGDASEADLAVLEELRARVEPLHPDEAAFLVTAPS